MHRKLMVENCNEGWGGFGIRFSSRTVQRTQRRETRRSGGITVRWILIKIIRVNLKFSWSGEFKLPVPGALESWRRPVSTTIMPDRVGRRDARRPNYENALFHSYWNISSMQRTVTSICTCWVIQKLLLDHRNDGELKPVPQVTFPSKIIQWNSLTTAWTTFTQIPAVG